MADTLIVVAESSRAKIYLMKNRTNPLTELANLVHTASRLHERELVSDRPGRTFNSRGSGRHAKSPPTATKRQEAMNFAKEVSAYIEDGKTRLGYDRLVLMAPPGFLGLLRKSLSDSTRQLIFREIDKNLVNADETSIRQYVTEM